MLFKILPNLNTKDAKKIKLRREYISKQYRHKTKNLNGLIIVRAYLLTGPSLPETINKLPNEPNPTHINHPLTTHTSLTLRHIVCSSERILDYSIRMLYM